MRISVSVKAKINNITKDSTESQSLLHQYIFERILERVSISKYKDNFILKGGMLLASIFGVNIRSTLDMDATIKGIELTKENARNMFDEILSTKIDDIKFKITTINEIRIEDEYKGYRINVEYNYKKMHGYLTIDVTAGDVITYKEINYSYSLLFEDKKIDLLTYNIETILAEKYETIISRNVLNTRGKDFYDIYMIVNYYFNDVNKNKLCEAIKNTSHKRETIDKVNDSGKLIGNIKSSKYIRDVWERYSEKYSYANEIKFESVVKSIEIINDILNKY